MSTNAGQNSAPSTTKRALRALQEIEAKLAALEAGRREPIAIVGMGCRLPGAKNLAAFWQLLCEGRDAIREVPPERWDINAYYDPDSRVGGKVASRWGGFLEGVEWFDAQFFGISPREAPYVDPRQRLMLEVCWEALEDAGIAPDSLAGSSTGVYVATLSNDYDSIVSQDYTLINSFTGTGTANSIVANRISYFLDLRGPSLVLDTACSGSLLAIDLACRSLRSGETTLALAGGVGVNLLPKCDIFFSSAGALSPDGRCQAFDRRANGIVRGEGAGVVVLKPLARAVADGDPIYAVILGGAVNHDGRSNGIMAPNGLAQEAVLREAYRQAGISPGLVQYVETHGTGTPLGDPIEVKALAAVLGTDRPPDRPCVLGSVKTNLGHLEATAGVTGVIKVALSLRHRLTPPNLHFQELNPLISLPSYPLRIQSGLDRWPAEHEPLVAGVSSFSFGGTNVHLVLQEAPPTPPAPPPQPEASRAYVLPLSARSPEALRALAAEYRQCLAGEGAEPPLRDVCYTAGVRRTHHEHRLAVVGESRAEVCAQLGAYLEGKEATGVSPGRGVSEGGGRVVFVFSGQGSHWPGMGRELYAHEPVFRESLEQTGELLERHVDWSLVEELLADEGKSRLHETAVVQPAIFAVQVALAALWRSWGVTPAATVGQSLGEVAAAHVAGALSLEDAVRVVFHRSRLMQTTAGRGRTAVVGLTPEQAQLALAGWEDHLSVAGSSGPTSSVISGDPSAIDQVLTSLQSKDIFCRILENIDVAFHSPQMEPLTGELIASLRGMTPRPATAAFFSTVTGGLLAGEALGAQYWARNLREPFRLAEVIRHLVAAGHETFLELSPHPVLAGALRQSLVEQRRTAGVWPSLVRGAGERRQMQETLGGLYAGGCAVEWARQYAGGGRVVSLPNYAWQRGRYWYDQLEGRGGKAAAVSRKAGEHPFAGESARSTLGSGEHYWETEIGAESLHYLKDHRIQGAVVFPGASYLEMALTAARQVFPGLVPFVEDVTFEHSLILSEDETRRLQLILSPTAAGMATFEVYSRPAGAPHLPQDWTLHAGGKILCLPAGTAPASGEISLPELKERCPEAMTSAEHYQTLQTGQFSYGPAFQAITQVWRREGEVLGRIQLPQTLHSGAEAYQIHPVMLDAGFQALAAALPASEGGTYLPLGLKGLRVYARQENQLWCRARLRPDSRAGASTLHADIQLFDDQGRVLVEVEGLSLKRLDAARPSARGELRESLYELQWRPKPLAEQSPAPPHPAGRWLILADGHGVGRALATALEARDQSCLLVFPGANPSDRQRPSERWLEARQPEQLERLVEEVMSADAEPWRGVVHLWGLDSAPPTVARRDDLERAQFLGGLSLLGLARGLAALGSGQRPRLWLVTRGAQPVAEAEGELEVLQAGVWGFGRVAAHELPELWGGLVDLAPALGSGRGSGDAERAAAQLCAELVGGDHEPEVAWRGAERYVARLAPWRGMRSPALPVQCRPDSSYLVTGGLSGLGLEAGRWLVEHGARRLVVVGRTRLPERGQWGGLEEGSDLWQRVAAIQQLERLGASVDYWAVDVADEDGMRARWLAYEREGWPTIRGVIHAAGEIADQLLLRMSAEAYARVQRPKVFGGWVLHELSQRRGVDFFVMYGSASGVLGQMGQANYAAANAFMDGLAQHRRRSGEAGLSIDWGPWAEVGMWSRLKPGEQQTLSGVDGITPEMGARVLSHIFNSPSPQVLVMAADWRKVRPSPLTSELILEGVGGTDSRETASRPAAVMLDLLLAEPSERKAIFESHLREAVSRTLGCDPAHLDVRKPLPNLGMDSIMAVELKNCVEAAFNLSVSMVDLFTSSVAQLVDRLETQLQHDERLSGVLAEIEQLSMDEVSASLAGNEPGDSGGGPSGGQS